MDYTIAILKPNVIEEGQVGEILRLMRFWKFTIEDMRYIKSADIGFVKEFYSVHKDKDFYDRLTNGMADRPWLAIKLGHKRAGDVVGWWRKWLQEVRKEYSGEELHDNAVHGSDSNESARRELELIFGSKEYFEFRYDGTFHKIKIEDVSSVEIKGMLATVILKNGYSTNLDPEDGRVLNKLLK